MSKKSKASGSDPYGLNVDAMRAASAPKGLGGTLSASSQQTNRRSTGSNGDNPILGLGATRPKTGFGSQEQLPVGLRFGTPSTPGGFGHPQLSMSSPLGSGGFAVPVSTAVGKTGKDFSELYNGPALLPKKDSLSTAQPNLFSFNAPLFSSAPPKGLEQLGGGEDIAGLTPQVQEHIRGHSPNVPEKLFSPLPLFDVITKTEQNHAKKTYSRLLEQTTVSYKAPAVRVYACEAVNLGSDTITITANKGSSGQKTFAVHKSLIMDRSIHLKSILLDDTNLKNIILDTADPQALALYIQHIYFGRLPSKSDIESSDSPSEYGLLANLYILGSELQDNNAKNAAVDALFAKAHESTELPSAEEVSIIYNGTKGPCPARKLMVDIYAYKATKASMQGQTFPSEFMVDFAMNLVASRSALFKPTMPKTGVENYHEE